MKIIRPVMLAMVVTSIALGIIVAQPKRGPVQRALQKVTGTPTRTWLNTNQLSTVVESYGYQDGWPSLFYPKGGGKSAVFLTELFWAYQWGPSREIQLGGSVPYTGWMQVGKILPSGVAEDPNLDKNRIYRVRPEIPPGNSSADIRSEIQQGEGTADQIYAQYHKDWNEWPWQDGAPWYGPGLATGTYDPLVDTPGVKGADQSIWYVCNDLWDHTTDPFGNLTYIKSIGIELQVTVWAYNRQDALGYVYFTRYLMIHKGQETMDSTYVSIFCDPDLGDTANDLIGTDTTRNLVYAYNGGFYDAVYSPLPPPAFGIDFFQGPVVAGTPTDSAIFRNAWVHGKKNLPLTASYAFTGSTDAVFGETPQGKNKTWFIEYFNLCKGLNRRAGVILDPRTGLPTKFRFAGDPEKRTGWLDGVDFPPGDRRLGLVSGPFTLAPGDTQEVVTAEVVAGALQGGDQLTSVHFLKSFDDMAQSAFDTFFDLPTAPPAPKVTATELDREIILTWDDPQAVAATENYNKRGFAFQGYNVYQFPTAAASVPDAKKLVTYDIVDGVTKIISSSFDPTLGMLVPKLLEEGTDSGIKRSLHLKTDIFNGDNRLVNGRPYYFAVTSYSYSPDSLANPSALENPIVVIKVMPHTPDPGTRYATSYGDTIAVTQAVSAGGTRSDGRVTPVVIDPSKLTGHTYRVSFDTVGGVKTWSLTDTTAGQVRLSGQQNFAAEENTSIVDGFLVKVTDVPYGFNDWQMIPPSHLVWSDSGGADGGGLEGFDPNGNGWGAIGIGEHWLSGSSTTVKMVKNVRIVFAACDGTWDPDSPPADSNYSFAYRYLRGAQSSAANPAFVPFIVNPVNYGFQTFKKSVPFSAWDIDASPPRRLAVGHLENNVAKGLVDGKYWPGLDTLNNWSTSGPREWFFIFDADYSTTPDPSFEVPVYPNALPIMWWGTPARSWNATFSSGDEFLAKVSHPFVVEDSFVFTAPANTVNDRALAKTDVQKINVFPNPYYGANPQETSVMGKFVTFSHLPQKAVFRIFNMGGVMVRYLFKYSSSQFFQWDLRNEFGLLVGSGLYIIHIDMPDIGATKILKLGVVQEQAILQ